VDVTEQIIQMIEVEGLLPERVATLLNVPLEMVYETLNDADDEICFEQYDEDIR
jgi:hypothetical protein